MTTVSRRSLFTRLFGAAGACAAASALPASAPAATQRAMTFTVDRLGAAEFASRLEGVMTKIIMESHARGHIPG